MADPVIPTDSKAALYTVCLFLAQPGEPHAELGYKTRTSAFYAIGVKFGVPENSVRNVRDIFDRFTDSDRVGWKNEELPQRFKTILDKHAGTGRENLRDISLKIMDSEWEKLDKEKYQDMNDWNQSTEAPKAFGLFDRIVAEVDAPTQVRLPMDSTNVAFSNTGRRSNGWFSLTLKEVVQTLQDLCANIDVITNKAGNPAEYEEKTWRDIFEQYLSDDVAQTMGKVQTLPLFELLSKIVHFSNFTEVRKPKTLYLTLEALEMAQKAVLDWHPDTAKAVKKSAISSVLKGGENVIFYGAPGTGKSNRVNARIKASGKKPIRTVFHPDLQNSDFFGVLKPQMNAESVRYGFSPGPFMKALAEAYKTPGEPVFLVIEEINRAAAAAVFGDLFLLLDRDDDGKGEYDVSFPSPESKEWFDDKTKMSHDMLLLPSNLFIYATMNSADQGVYPIDTAFRRRWRQEYLPLDYDKGPDGDISYVDAAGTHHTLTWREFIRLLNNHLTSSQTLDIAEDRLLGQWFVKKKELDGKGIPEKVLLYLWDDLLRHERDGHVFHSGKNGTVNTYGDLVIEAAAGRRFLSDSFLGKLNAVSDVEPDQENETGDNAS